MKSIPVMTTNNMNAVSSGKCISNFLRSQDSLGYPVSLTYKGENTYRSSLGGFLTLIGKLLILIYFCFQIKAVILQEKKKVTANIEKVDLLHSPIIYLNDSNFKVAIKLEYSGMELPYYDFTQETIDQYLMIQFYELEINIYNESNNEKNLKSAAFKEKYFPSQKCDKDYFKKNHLNVDEKNF